MEQLAVGEFDEVWRVALLIGSLLPPVLVWEGSWAADELEEMHIGLLWAKNSGERLSLLSPGTFSFRRILVMIIVLTGEEVHGEGSEVPVEDGEDLWIKYPLHLV